MGFFAKAHDSHKGPSLDLIHQLECRACPLYKTHKDLCHPNMKPTGSKKPLVYILGEAPGKTEDEEGEQFVGESGELLRPRLPRSIDFRFNNCVRTRPTANHGKKNRTPENIEIEACRPSVERDIGKTKPKAIFGFGNIPLKWASTFTGITAWRGRRFPVTIGGHTCWFYPMLHPAYVLRLRKGRGGGSTKFIGSEEERAYVFDLKRALAELDVLPEPIVHDRRIVEKNIEIFPGDHGQFRKLRSHLEWAMKQPAVGVDYETKRIRPYYADSKILTAAVGTEEFSFAFAMDHPQAGWSRKERGEIDEMWKEFLVSPCRKISHNLPFEQTWTAFFYGLETIHAAPWECTLTQASTIDERRGGKESKTKKGQGPLSLEFLCYQYFGFDLKKMNPVNRKALDKEPIERVLRYNAPDAKYHYLLWVEQRKRLVDMGLMTPYKLSRARVRTCVGAEHIGMDIDQEETKRLSARYSNDAKEANEAISELKEIRKFAKMYGEEFSATNNHHVAYMLRTILKCKEGLQIDEKTGDEKYVTDKNVLAKVDHPIAPLILDVRRADKKISTYLYQNSEDKTVLWPDGKIHPIFNHGPRARTHRTTSEDPNAQNMPMRDEANREVRAQVVAPPRHVIAKVDYGQLQHRILAMASKDRATIKALWEGYDVHGAYALKVAKAYPERIGGRRYLKDTTAMSNMRTDIKNQWTFPLFFGARLESVGGYLKIPYEELEEVFEEFKDEFKGVFDWQQKVKDFYYEHGYVENLCGRRRHAPLGWNEMINTPIQGTEPELVMHAMNRLATIAIKEDDLYLHPRVQVHDELQFVLPDKKLDHYLDRILNVMIDMPFKFVNVPIVCELSLGPNLLDMEKICNASSDGKWVWHGEKKAA